MKSRVSTNELRRQHSIERALDRAERTSRLYLSAVLLAAVLLVLILSVVFQESGRLYLLKLTATALLAFLPGWLYLLFIRNKGQSLYDEFVLNLFRLHIDEWGNLPAPPQHTRYYASWKKAHERLETESKDNLYRRKFEAVYGQTSVSTLRLIIDKEKFRYRTETFSPVVYATLVMCMGWVLVLQPEILGAVTVPDLQISGRPILPYEPLQFGFLGAYTFIIQDLIRRYYRDDLRTSAYISAVSRIVLVAVLVTAVDLIWTGNAGNQPKIFAFLIGFFPQIGLQALQAALTPPLRRLIPSLRTEYPLSALEGLNIWYESRLVEEGIEDMENLVSANLVDLMLRTRAPIMRIVDWLDQAFLHLHVPQDPDKVAGVRVNLRRLGIRTATDLERCYKGLAKDSVFCSRLSEALEVDEEEGPVIARSVLKALEGEANYWHIREFKRLSWLRQASRHEQFMPAAVPRGNGHSELAQASPSGDAP